jgi:hypothetical protein
VAKDALEALKLIVEDTEADAVKPVEFNKLGIGTIYGEVLAMIRALARAQIEHLELHRAAPKGGED